MPRKKKVAQPSPNAAAAAAAANSPPEAASPPTLETTASNESAEADMSEAEDGGTSPQSNRSDGGLAGMESPRENVWEDLDSLQSPGAGGGIPSTIVRGIIVGTIASSKVSTSKVVDESEASHQWSCFVRGPDDYDVSTFIKQVVFSLHPSFNNSVRSFKSPPYEIHEEGWGEFDIAVKLHFWPDSQLRPVEFIHQLKLYPNENAAAAQAVSKKPVVNEIYHELIFTEPEPTFAKRLSTRVLGAGNQSALARYREDIRAHFRPFDDNEKAKAIKKVKKCSETIMSLSQEQRDRLKQIVQETTQLQTDIQALGGTPIEPGDAINKSFGSTSPTQGAAGAAAGGEEVQEATGRGRRKSKGRKR